MYTFCKDAEWAGVVVDEIYRLGRPEMAFGGGLEGMGVFCRMQARQPATGPDICLPPLATTPGLRDPALMESGS
jgi:hypothetical protein